MLCFSMAEGASMQKEAYRTELPNNLKYFFCKKKIMKKFLRKKNSAKLIKFVS